MKHIKNAKVTAKIQIREGAQIRVLGGTGTGTRYQVQVLIIPGTRYRTRYYIEISYYNTF